MTVESRSPSVATEGGDADGDGRPLIKSDWCVTKSHGTVVSRARGSGHWQSKLSAGTYTVRWVARQWGPNTFAQIFAGLLLQQGVT
jgi:hypothetical protein